MAGSRKAHDETGSLRQRRLRDQRKDPTGVGSEHFDARFYTSSSRPLPEKRVAWQPAAIGLVAMVGPWFFVQRPPSLPFPYSMLTGGLFFVFNGWWGVAAIVLSLIGLALVVWTLADLLSNIFVTRPYNRRVTSTALGRRSRR